MTVLTLKRLRRTGRGFLGSRPTSWAVSGCWAKPVDSALGWWLEPPGAADWCFGVVARATRSRRFCFGVVARATSTADCCFGVVARAMAQAITVKQRWEFLMAQAITMKN